MAIIIAQTIVRQASRFARQCARPRCPIVRAEWNRQTYPFSSPAPASSKARTTSTSSPGRQPVERELLSRTRPTRRTPILAGLRRLGHRILTGIHEPAQAAPAAEVCDVLQIPTFLCRQTDLLIEAARTGRTVNIKKRQFVSPRDIRLAAEMAAATGAATSGSPSAERRSDTTLVVDVRGLIQPLARAAAAVGVDGLFVEMHEDPARALSDGANALPLERLGPLWRRFQAVAAAAAAS